MQEFVHPSQELCIISCTTSCQDSCMRGIQDYRSRTVAFAALVFSTLFSCFVEVMHAEPFEGSHQAVASVEASRTTNAVVLASLCTYGLVSV